MRNSSASPLILLVVCAMTLAGCGGASAARPEVAHSATKRSDVVMVGLGQLGAPYVYGGKSPAQGFDCSGLTHFAHSRAGIVIPRTALKQRAAARPVKRRRLKPGDMAFFKTGPNSYHVGLMVDGQRFVHASTSRRRVRYGDLSNPYWRSHFIGGGTYLR